MCLGEGWEALRQPKSQRTNVVGFHKCANRLFLLKMTIPGNTKPIQFHQNQRMWSGAPGPQNTKVLKVKLSQGNPVKNLDPNPRSKTKVPPPLPTDRVPTARPGRGWANALPNLQPTGGWSRQVPKPTQPSKPPPTPEWWNVRAGVPLVWPTPIFWFLRPVLLCTRQLEVQVVSPLRPKYPVGGDAGRIRSNDEVGVALSGCRRQVAAIWQ